MKTKKLYFLLVSVLFLVVLTACGGTNENQKGTETEESEVDVTEESAEQEDVETEDSTIADDQSEGTESVEQEEVEVEPENGDAAVESLKEEATYNGQGDTHTIEVETAEETIALQINEFMDDEWASLESGTPMTIEYYKNDMGQLILIDYTVE